MTIPEAAIEAAAEASWRFAQDTHRMHIDIEPKPEWAAMGQIVKDIWRDEARAAIEAAMPAIREALAQEIEAAHDMAVAERRSDSDPNAYARMTAYDHAARIVRGGTP